MKTFAIILSGCGVYDGSEIHEAVLTMLAIKKNCANYKIFAPNFNQTEVVNHLSGEKMNETRNVLIESARIARGDIKNLKEYNPLDFTGIIFPGGFGVAKNLCDYAFKGADCKVNPEIIDVVIQTYKAGKLIGAECIAPVMITSILENSKVTIGTDSQTASHIVKLKGQHINAKYNEVVYDVHYKLYTTPCYMTSVDILQVFESVEALVKAMCKN